MRAFYCGVPIEQCTGSSVTLNAAWSPDVKSNNKSGKLHHARDAAFRCFCAHLLRTGHKRIGAREFETPRGTVLVLDRISRFGAEFRAGKEGDKSSSRFTPRHGRGAVCEASTELATHRHAREKQQQEEKEKTRVR